MTDYTVLHPVNHDGVLFGAGDVLALSPEQAAPLLAVGAIGAGADDNTDANAGDETLDEAGDDMRDQVEDADDPVDTPTGKKGRKGK